MGPLEDVLPANVDQVHYDFYDLKTTQNTMGQWERTLI